jgi:GT2 family glycosyltransferase
MSIKSTPVVYIVTINWNGLADTLECLGSLKLLDYKNFQTVVIDNGSSNAEADKIKLKYPGIKLIKNSTNLGFTGACNQGIDLAMKHKADYVLLLNNDTIITPEFLTKTVKFYESTADAGMVSPIVVYNDRKTVWFAGAKIQLGIVRHTKNIKLSDIKRQTEPIKTEFVPGAALLVSAKLIKLIGKLDDKYFAYYEDVDWCYRAKAAGYNSYVVPQALIYHKKSASTGDGDRSKRGKVPAYFLARNGLLFATNLSGFKKAVYLANQFIFKLPLSLVLLVKPSAWSSYIRGLFDGLVNKKQITIFNSSTTKS